MSEVSDLKKINEKIHEYQGSSSSSDSDDEKPSFQNSRKKRLFGRKDTVHSVLGGGKCMFLSNLLVIPFINFVSLGMILYVFSLFNLRIDDVIWNCYILV